MTSCSHEGLASQCLSVITCAQEVLGGHAGRQRGHALLELWLRLLQMQERQRRTLRSGTHRSRARLAQCTYRLSTRCRHAAHQVKVLVQLWHAFVSPTRCPSPAAWASSHIQHVMSTSPLAPGHRCLSMALRMCAAVRHGRLPYRNEARASPAGW